MSVKSLSKQQIDCKMLSKKDKIVKNGQLFNAIRKNKPIEEKLKKVQKHLDEGANINAGDANDKNNVPLHIAILKGEPEIVKLLLDKGAIIDTKNADDKTPSDIAKLPDTPNGQEIVSILNTYLKKKNTNLVQSSNQQALLSPINNPVKESCGQSCGQFSVKQQPEQKITRGNVKINIQKVNIQKDKQSPLNYQKRSGTSGLSGQLYETKLLGLLLFRALNNKEIDKFYLGTNIDGIGAFDDLIFRYNLKGQEKPKFIFIQAKHRDDPDKERVTVEKVRKRNGDFSLHKYLDSYLRIKQKFNPNSNDEIFKSEFKNIDCDFVIYTPAKENFSKKKFVEQLCTSKDDLIHVNETGKTFQFKYEEDDVDILVKTASESRTKLLAESLAKFILSDGDNCIYMMSDELIRSYHVILAQKVIKVSDMESGDCCKGKFLPTFFDSNEDLLSILKETLYKEIVVTHSKKSMLQSEEIKDLVNEILKDPSADTISKLIGSVLIFDEKNSRLKFIGKKIPQEIILLKDNLEKIQIKQDIIKEAIAIAGKVKLELLSFKLPSTFGNLSFKIRGNEQEREERLNHLTSKFIELLKTAKVTSNNIVEIDDNMVGPEKILKYEDMKINGGIGGLVGNLLILDDETKMLKFNSDKESMPGNAGQLLKKLKSEISDDKYLSSYRFEINVNGFPRLSLAGEEYEKNLVKDFLSKLRFYTNQAKEDEVEKILKEEINQHCNDNKEQNEFPFRIKCDAIFLKVHDRIQKWWKQPKETPYLTKSCKLFDEAKKDFIDSPLLAILNFIYIKKITKYDIKFNQDAIQTLELNKFNVLNKFNKFTEVSDERILNIVTNENTLSGIKLTQYFSDRNIDYYFIDLNYVLEEAYYEVVISELEETKLCTLIIECKRRDDIKEFCEKLKNIINVSNNRIILVTDNILSVEFETCFPEKYIEKINEKNSLIDLTPESQIKLLTNNKIKFQGKEISLGTLISQGIKNLIDEETLSVLVKNNKIEIGEALADSEYDDIKDYYIDRTFNRQVKIKEIFKQREFLIVDNSHNINQINFQQNQDIVLISNIIENFKKLCYKYKKHNIHWLKEENNEFIWQQSHGTLSKLRQFIDEQSKEYELKKITDFTDKIVIIAAEPGMGKSTVLTKLAEETKKSEPSLWIVRINLLDHSSEFSKWKDGGKNINITDAVKFLYKTMDFQAFKKNAEQSKKKKEQIINNVLELITIENIDEIVLKNNGEKKIKGLALLEIELFNYFYNQGKITLLFDGFDEISPDYKKEVIELLEILKESKIERLWITTRSYNIQSELEDKLSTFSYVLKPFLENDQRNFLEKFWKINLQLNVLDLDRFNIFTDELLKEFSQSINHQERDFISIPLHIKMIATIFQDNFKNFHHSEYPELSDEHKQKLSEKLNLVTLYKEFFRIKFDEILFGEKVSIIPNKTDPKIKEMLDDRCKLITDKYEKLALYKLFNEDKLKCLCIKEERDKISDLIKEVEEAKEKTGIIIRVTNNQPVFIHETFAEYFAAIYLWKKFKSIQFDVFKKEFIEIIIIGNLVINNRIQICKFFQLESLKDLENNINFVNKESKLNFLFTELVRNIYRYGSHIYKNIKQSTKLLLNIIEFSLSEEESNLVIIENVQNISNDKLLALLSISAEMGYIKLVNALETKLNTEFVKNYLTNGKWIYSPLWLAAKNGHLDVVQFLLKKLSYDTTWQDCNGQILVECIFQKMEFSVLRSCLSLNIIDGKPYKYMYKEELPIVAALNLHAPSDVIKLLIEKTDADLINKFKNHNYIKTSNNMNNICMSLLKYDKEIIEEAIKKGVDFSRDINVMLYEFTYQNSYLAINLGSNIELNSFLNEIFSKLFDRIELLLKSGIGYNYKDSEHQSTTLQHAKQIYYVHKLLNRVYILHNQKYDKNCNLLDTILKLIIDSINRSSVNFERYKNNTDIRKIFSFFNFNCGLFIPVFSFFSLHYMKEIYFPRLNMAELLFETYSNTNLINSTLDKLHFYISNAREQIEQFKIDSFMMYNYVEMLMLNGTEQDIRQYESLNKFVKNLLYRVLELYRERDYKIDDALKEVSEEVLKFGKIINRLMEIKHLDSTKVIYETHEILDILDIKSVDTNEELQNLMSEIYECGGIHLLSEVWFNLNLIGKKRIMRILETMFKWSDQSSKIFELLKILDSSYNKLTDAIKNRNCQKIIAILQNVEPDFIKAIINGQDDKYGSPLHYAACEGEAEVIEILLDFGANPNNKLEENGKLLLSTTSTTEETERDEDSDSKRDEESYKGWMPLHLAALNGHKEVVQKLIDEDAIIDATTDEGLTSLHIAAKNGYLEIVKLFLQCDIDPNVKDEKGETPLDLAQKQLIQNLENNNLREIVDILNQQINT